MTEHYVLRTVQGNAGASIYQPVELGRWTHGKPGDYAAALTATHKAIMETDPLGYGIELVWVRDRNGKEQRISTFWNKHRKGATFTEVKSLLEMAAGGDKWAPFYAF